MLYFLYSGASVDVAGADVDEEGPGEWQTISEGFLHCPNGEEPHEEGWQGKSTSPSLAKGRWSGDADKDSSNKTFQELENDENAEA